MTDKISSLALTFFALGGGLVILQGVTAATIIFTRFNPEKSRLVLGVAGLACALIGATVQISDWARP